MPDQGRAFIGLRCHVITLAFGIGFFDFDQPKVLHQNIREQPLNLGGCAVGPRTSVIHRFEMFLVERNLSHFGCHRVLYQKLPTFFRTNFGVTGHIARAPVVPSLDQAIPGLDRSPERPFVSSLRECAGARIARKRRGVQIQAIGKLRQVSRSALERKSGCFREFLFEPCLPPDRVEPALSRFDFLPEHRRQTLDAVADVGKVGVQFGEFALSLGQGTEDLCDTDFFVPRGFDFPLDLRNRA
jgi:hypothetical protein